MISKNGNSDFYVTPQCVGGLPEVQVDEARVQSTNSGTSSSRRVLENAIVRRRESGRLCVHISSGKIA